MRLLKFFSQGSYSLYTKGNEVVLAVGYAYDDDDGRGPNCWFTACPCWRRQPISVVYRSNRTMWVCVLLRALVSCSITTPGGCEIEKTAYKDNTVRAGCLDNSRIMWCYLERSKTPRGRSICKHTPCNNNNHANYYILGGCLFMLSLCSAVMMDLCRSCCKSWANKPRCFVLSRPQREWGADGLKVN